MDLYLQTIKSLQRHPAKVFIATLRLQHAPRDRYRERRTQCLAALAG